MKLLKFSAGWCCNCRRIGTHGAEVIDVDDPLNGSLLDTLEINELPIFVLLGVTGELVAKIHPETDEEVEQWLKAKGYAND